MYLRQKNIVREAIHSPPNEHTARDRIAHRYFRYRPCTLIGGKVRTAVLLPFPRYYNTVRSVCQYLFKKYFLFFRFPLYGKNAQRTPCPPQPSPRAPNMSSSTTIVSFHLRRYDTMSHDEMSQQNCAKIAKKPTKILKSYPFARILTQTFVTFALFTNGRTCGIIFEQSNMCPPDRCFLPNQHGVFALREISSL